MSSFLSSISEVSAFTVSGRDRVASVSSSYFLFCFVLCFALLSVFICFFAFVLVALAGFISVSVFVSVFLLLLVRIYSYLRTADVLPRGFDPDFTLTTTGGSLVFIC